MAGLLARLVVGAVAFFVGNAASAQDNAACDAACPVPCYFGSCSPAKATYERALDRCDLDQLDAVTRLYGGTVSARKAGEALTTLRALGYSTSRIGASPNTGGQSCADLVNGGGKEDPCTKVSVPSGFRCIVQNGLAVLMQNVAPVPAPVSPATTVASLIGPRPAGGEAAREYDKCIAGTAGSCTQLGFLYWKGRSGLTPNGARTVALYRHGCDGGSGRGCTNLGFMYENGYDGLAQDYSRAVELYRKGCDNGNGQGCTNLGFLYRNGNAGLAKDEALAASLYRQGCDSGNARGCGNLGFMYEAGYGGLGQDYSRAAELFRKGCDGGGEYSCSNLGTMYENGKGVPVDLTRARELYKQGCDGGHERGCTWLENLQ